MTHQENVHIETHGRGMIEITREISALITRSGVHTGLAHILCLHTSCSLMLMENADPSARADLVRWLDRLVPENDPLYSHTSEGPDDMPAHIKMALTRSSETLPVSGGQACLGTWQGLFLWEHRRTPHTRRLVVTIQGEPRKNAS